MEGEGVKAGECRGGRAEGEGGECGERRAEERGGGTERRGREGEGRGIPPCNLPNCFHSLNRD